MRLLANSIVAGVARLCPAACFSGSRLLLHEADRLKAMPYITGVAVSKLPAERSCFLGEKDFFTVRHYCPGSSMWF